MTTTIETFGRAHHRALVGADEVGAFGAETTIEARQHTMAKMAGRVREALKALGHTASDPIGLIGTGLSGALLVPSLADSLGLPFMLVRKDDERSPHTGDDTAYIAGRRGDRVGMGASRYLFVDDLIDNGGTLKFAAKHAPSPIIGAVLYGSAYTSWLAPSDDGTDVPTATGYVPLEYDKRIPFWGERS